MSELDRLINRINKGITSEAAFISSIRYPKLLLESLKELRAVIGNDKVKDSVATQVLYLIMSKRRYAEGTGVEEDSMLNTILYGPPGVGKTLICTKMSKIWYALGYLDSTGNTSGQRSSVLPPGSIPGISTETGEMDNTMLIYVLIFALLIFISVMSMILNIGKRYGTKAAIFVVVMAVIFILAILYALTYNISNEVTVKQVVHRDVQQKKEVIVDEETPVEDKPNYSDMVKIVSRGDFIDKYVGWTEKKTLKLLNDNIGKVLFVDEAYSILNGPHDEFGMEALTAINLFLSQNPNKIVVIFAGYKDLLDTGIFTAQPGLSRRFMWHFTCEGYTNKELYSIFMTQMSKKGYRVDNELALRKLFEDNADGFPNYGGDTEKLVFLSSLERSRDYVRDGAKESNKARNDINLLTVAQISRGIAKLRENSVDHSKTESTNPLAVNSLMKMMNNMKKNDSSSSSSTRDKRRSIYDDSVHRQDSSTGNTDDYLVDEEIMNILKKSSNKHR
jgi:hypothetical protein